METKKLNKISKALSSKVFDPISDGKADGKLFSAELRLGYINRAYGTLIRTLETIHPKLLKVFKDYYQIIPIEVTEGSHELKENYDVFDVYYADEDGGKQKRAASIDPVNYKTTENGQNDFREATEESRYWTIINNKIMLLPKDAEYFNVELVARNSFPEFEYDGDFDLNIPMDYMDLLMLFAVLEAMSDKGESGKYQLYTASLNGKLSLLADSKKVESIKEEGKS